MHDKMFFFLSIETLALMNCINFTHKKKISSGGRKYLPFKHAGLYIPDVYLKHLTLRVSLIKKLFYKLSNQQVIPSWGEILIYVLKLYGFDPKTLFRTLGIQDVAIVHHSFGHTQFLGPKSLLRRYCNSTNDTDISYIDPDISSKCLIHSNTI